MRTSTWITIIGVAVLVLIIGLVAGFITVKTEPAATDSSGSGSAAKIEYRYVMPIEGVTGATKTDNGAAVVENATKTDNAAAAAKNDNAAAAAKTDNGAAVVENATKTDSESERGAE